MPPGHLDKISSEIDTSQCAVCIELTAKLNTLYMLLMFILQSGRTPLKAACEGGHSVTAQLLIEKGADLDKQDRV